ncbi:MAG: IS630 family transposase [Actinomycetota bacterium]|nr:IS630 family transposase [Actinomycetota bacterium]
MRSKEAVLSEADRDTLARMSRKGKAAQRDVLRARIILLTAEGESDLAVAEQLQINRHTVRLWRQRFAEKGLAGLTDTPGRGRKPVLPHGVKDSILTGAVQPPPHRTRWSCRSMAKAHKVSKSTVQRLWSNNDIKPHLIRTFKISNDPRFEEKFWDVIGLYLNPPDKALVLCCDEKSQCQALERTQPGLPLGVGHIKTATHDYIRHGTVTLFAALNYLEGKIVSMLAEKHRHQEWLKFLKRIDHETPAGVELHLIADNYATHKHADVQQWLAKHKRFHMHFTPTSASWMNLVERFFRDLTVDVVREGSFQHVKELCDQILAYLAERNANPTRYIWKAKGEDILRKIHRARQVLTV